MDFLIKWPCTILNDFILVIHIIHNQTWENYRNSFLMSIEDNMHSISSIVSKSSHYSQGSIFSCCSVFRILVHVDTRLDLVQVLLYVWWIFLLLSLSYSDLATHRPPPSHLPAASQPFSRRGSENTWRPRPPQLPRWRREMTRTTTFTASTWWILFIATTVPRRRSVRYTRYE